MSGITQKISMMTHETEHFTTREKRTMRFSHTFGTCSADAGVECAVPDSCPAGQFRTSVARLPNCRDPCALSAAGLLEVQDGSKVGCPSTWQGSDNVRRPHICVERTEVRTLQEGAWKQGWRLLSVLSPAHKMIFAYSGK